MQCVMRSRGMRRTRLVGSRAEGREDHEGQKDRNEPGGAMPGASPRALRVALAALAATSLLGLGRPALSAPAFVAVNRFVPHVSTVPANAGEKVGIFVHEKLTQATADAVAAGRSSAGVVLFVHGQSVPTVPDFDLQYKDYSWMEDLAAAGFDTFSMDQTGYGFSPRPEMDDPCNMSAKDQAIVTPNPLPKPCKPSYSHTLTSFQSDWDEIDSVVDYLRKLRGVKRVSLIGWSMGGPRAGGYAARHPDKIEKLILYAPAYRASTPSEPPSDGRSAGVPMSLQTRQTLMQDRWQANVACPGQVDPGIRDVIWRTIMGFDSLGAVWGPPEGVMRVRTSTYFGWNSDYAAKITAPTLILVGQQDGLRPAAETLYGDLTRAPNKVLVEMACATHFAVWEAAEHKLMHEASKEWLQSGEFRGRKNGQVSVGTQGGQPGPQ
ncbi:MAG TPA: alpha/beta hydrolase [Gammaproteobacteria bacterium]|nr:alpha/beta hydrolase [Gammaproteobacteria bacterium]